MKRTILGLSFLFVGLVNAGTLWVDKVEIKYNDKYSFGDFTDKKFTDAKDMKNMVIVGSCFYQQKGPDTKVFPDAMTGVTFIRCNLDNVLIPPGNKCLDGTKKRVMKFDVITIQDGKETRVPTDFMVDKDNKPIKRMDETTGDDNEKATAADFSAVGK